MPWSEQLLGTLCLTLDEMWELAPAGWVTNAASPCGLGPTAFSGRDKAAGMRKLQPGGRASLQTLPNLSRREGPHRSTW